MLVNCSAAAVNSASSDGGAWRLAAYRPGCSRAKSRAAVAAAITASSPARPIAALPKDCLRRGLSCARPGMSAVEAELITPRTAGGVLVTREGGLGGGL